MVIPGQVVCFGRRTKGYKGPSEKLEAVGSHYWGNIKDLAGKEV